MVGQPHLKLIYFDWAVVGQSHLILIQFAWGVVGQPHLILIQFDWDVMGQPHLILIRLFESMGPEHYRCDAESGATTGNNNVITTVIVSAHSFLAQSRHYTLHHTETIRNPLNRKLRQSAPAQPEGEKR